MARFNSTGIQGPQGPEGPQGPQGPQGVQGEPGPAGADANIGNFEFDESTISTFDDMSILVTGVPGEISLSAYAGITLQYHEDYGVFLRDNTVPTNKVASIGDIGVETSFTVLGGTMDFANQTAEQPTFDGDPLFTGSYIRMANDLVYFRIEVDFDNITDFGNGQYYVVLPFNAKYKSTVRSGCLHRDSNNREYEISGHVEAGSNILTLWYNAGSGQDEEFDHNSPYNLQVEDDFHVAGTYLAENI